MKYQVIVGNLGMACDTEDRFLALMTYHKYVDQSKSGTGKAGNEAVRELSLGQK